MILPSYDDSGAATRTKTEGGDGEPESETNADAYSSPTPPSVFVLVFGFDIRVEFPIVFRFSPPSPAELSAHLTRWNSQPLSYPAAGHGLTREGKALPGYAVDHNRQLLGHGEAVFACAVAAMQAWHMFALSWVTLLGAGPIEAGRVVAVMPRHFGLYSLNPCRILYSIDEHDRAGRRFGFGYGTLPDHVARGEERFLVEWRREDDSVTYDILAYSRPRHPLIWLGYPVSRAFQRRFARDSKAAMLRAVA